MPIILGLVKGDRKMGIRRWGKKEWIVNYWLRRMKEPFKEPYSMRQVFYEELPEIDKFVPDDIKTKTKNWAWGFYNDMCRYLSDLVLDGQASYRTINIYEDSGASKHIWQNVMFVKTYDEEEAKVDYPIEIWVENNATYNSLVSLLTGNYRPFNVNLLSQKGFAKTQEIETLKLDRKEDVKMVLGLTDFDCSGYFMFADLQRRFKQINLDVEIIRIGILPQQIPEERRIASLIPYAKKDPRRKKFLKEFYDDPMVQKGFGYEIQALNPSEIRQLVLQSLTETILNYGLEKRES